MTPRSRSLSARCSEAALVHPWKFLLFQPIVLLLSTCIRHHSRHPLPQLQQLSHILPSRESMEYRGRRSRFPRGDDRRRPAQSYFRSRSSTGTRSRRTNAKGGRADPEDRLLPCIYAGVLIVIGLAGFAATDGGNIPDHLWCAIRMRDRRRLSRGTHLPRR